MLQLQPGSCPSGYVMPFPGIGLQMQSMVCKQMQQRRYVMGQGCRASMLSMSGCAGLSCLSCLQPGSWSFGSSKPSGALGLQTQPRLL